MIVTDASAVIEFLLGTPAGERIGEVLGKAGLIQAPALLDVEITQVLRRLVRSRHVSADHGRALVEILQAAPIDRRPMDPVLPRIWQLRDNLTAYDAAYVALAEAMDCPLLTLDERIEGAPGLQVEVIAPRDP